MSTPDDRSAELVVAFLEGTATEEERAELERRLPGEPELAERLALQARMTVSIEALGRQRSEATGLEWGLVRSPSSRRGLLAGAAAALLVAALAYLLWPSAPAPQPAPFPRPRVTAVSGPVHVLYAWTEIHPPRALQPGDIVHVGRGGEAVIEYAGEATRLRLGGETEVAVSAVEGAKDFVVSRGELAAEVARQRDGFPMVFRTPHARVEVVGTELTLWVGPTATRLEVKEGRALIQKADDSGAIEVEGGNYAVAEKGRALSLERSLAGRPRGLRGEYFDTTELGALKVTRLDPRVDFAWAKEPPAPGVEPEGFSVRWTGHVLPRATEKYTFYARTDDGVRLWVNGELVIDHWAPQGRTERSGAARLRAWELAELRMEYFDSGGPAAAQLSWSSPSTPKEVIPEESLFAPLEGARVQGLRGEYFDHEDFSALKMTRIDSKVNFTWGMASPHPSIEPDYFSIRWTGFVEPQYSETYTFYTVSDDGVRLWVDDQLLIDDWKVRGTEERSGSIALSAGRRYAIRLEYFDCVSIGQIHLSWSSPSQRKEIIPQSWLYPPR